MHAAVLLSSVFLFQHKVAKTGNSQNSGVHGQKLFTPEIKCHEMNNSNTSKRNAAKKGLCSRCRDARRHISISCFEFSPCLQEKHWNFYTSHPFACRNNERKVTSGHHWNSGVAFLNHWHLWLFAACKQIAVNRTWTAECYQLPLIAEIIYVQNIQW